MAWTEITRRQQGRRSLSYASDCTDAEWAVVEPFLAKRSKVEEVAGAGHWVHHDQRDVFLKLVRHFLAD